MGDKSTCTGGAATALSAELISTVYTLKHDVAEELGSMEDDARPDDSSGAAGDA